MPGTQQSFYPLDMSCLRTRWWLRLNYRLVVRFRTEHHSLGLRWRAVIRSSAVLLIADVNPSYAWPIEGNVGSIGYGPATNVAGGWDPTIPFHQSTSTAFRELSRQQSISPTAFAGIVEFLLQCEGLSAVDRLGSLKQIVDWQYLSVATQVSRRQLRSPSKTVYLV